MFSPDLYFHLTFGVLLTLVAYLVAGVIRRFVRIMDVPNHRSSHVKSIPKAGGIAVVLAFYIGLTFTWLLGGLSGLDSRVLPGLVISTLLIAAISLIDDITDQPAILKLITQMIAVVIALSMGIALDQIAIPYMGYVDLGWIGLAISFFWILGLTNAYNFMDGLDGLASGVAVIAALFFIVISYTQGSTFVYIIGYSLLAGSLGFLFLNFPPAKIILGDVGAAFLGFVFALLAIVAARYDESRTSFLVIPMLLFNFIFDTTYTVVKRCLQGKNILEAHREHLYQLMNRSGFSHMEVVLTQYCMVFLQGLGALWIVNIPGEERLLVFVPFLCLQVAYCWQVNRLFQRSLKKTEARTSK